MLLSCRVLAQALDYNSENLLYCPLHVESSHNHSLARYRVTSHWKSAYERIKQQRVELCKSKPFRTLNDLIIALHLCNVRVFVNLFLQAPPYSSSFKRKNNETVRRIISLHDLCGIMLIFPCFLQSSSSNTAYQPFFSGRKAYHKFRIFQSFANMRKFPHTLYFNLFDSEYRYRKLSQ